MRIFYLSCILILIVSCKKDSDLKIQEDRKVSSVLFQRYDWSEQELKFFSLENDISDKSNSRSAQKTLFHPLLIESYNEIALQNEEYSFVDSIMYEFGYPLWSKSYIYHNRNSDQNLTIIPLVVDNEEKISGIVTVHKQKNEGLDKFIINGISRQELLENHIDSSDYRKKCSIIEWTFQYQNWLYDGEADYDLEGSYCDCFENSSGDGEQDEQGGSEDCIWRILYICSDLNTQTSWVSGAKNIPLHLDHDQDGIYNWDDQDWHDLEQRFSVTQKGFEEQVFDWWEENYYEEHGEYDQFWDEWGDGGQDVGEFWSDVQDIWDSFWDWIDDAFGNEPYDDIYYEPSDHNYGCYDDWVTNGKKAESRTIRCEWYYVLDCGDEGGNWWDQFKDVVQCPECPVYEDYQEMFRDRLYAYWQETSLKIDFSHLYSLVSDACDGFAPDFEACVQRIYDEHRMTLIESFIMDYRLDYSSHIFAQAAADCNLSNNFSTCLAEVFLNGFLRVNPMLDLTEDEINWLVNRPDVVEELSNISERFTPETIDYFISVIS